MKPAIKAGILYFLFILAATFVLGFIRLRLIVPAGGEWVGLAIELPVTLALVWVISRWLVRKLRVPAESAPRLAMGGLALALLLATRALVSAIALGQSLAEHLANYEQPHTMIGLAAQLLFALMPWLRMHYTRTQRADWSEPAADPAPPTKRRRAA
jgi:hypothetical protein